MPACDGAVHGAVAKARSNRTPRAANRARLGLVSRSYPYSDKLPARTVSSTISSTFFDPAGAAVAVPRPTVDSDAPAAVAASRPTRTTRLPRANRSKPSTRRARNADVRHANPAASTRHASVAIGARKSNPR